MKPRHACLILLLLTTIAFQAKADNLGYTKDNPLIFGVDMDYAPLEYVGADGIPRGYDVEFTKELMNRMDIPFTYAPNTWANISGDVISGKVDLGMMVYSPYRKNIVNYSRAVFRLYYQIVYRQAQSEGTRRFDVRNLSGKRVAFMSSQPVADTLTKAGAVLEIVKDLPQAMRDLSGGEYDAVICFRYQAKYLINTYALSNLKSEDLTLTPREYCYVSHDKQLIDAISNELDKMEADGTITEIYGMDVTSEFGKMEIPQWVYALVSLLVILFLLVIVVLMQQSRKRLRKEMERAQRSEQLKTVFLGNMSHALRTPLNAIIGFSDLMISSGDDMPGEEREQLLELVNQNGLQLLHFINELLELSNIEGSDMLFNRVVTDIEQEMTAYETETRMQLPEAVGLVVNAPAGGLRALLDPRLLRYVTTHLLNNAVQHTSEGTITLTYGPKDDGLFVSIADTGSGLPEGLKENIFSLLSDKNTFTQEETPGLGLSICKAIIDRSNGKIWAESETGQGSTFSFWIPCKIL